MKSSLLLSMIVGLTLAGCGDSDSGVTGDEGYLSTAPFPDHIDKLPADYTGTTFKLSQAYPKTKPTHALPFKSIDFRSDPDGYLLAVRKYAYEGNIVAGREWRGYDNTKRKWYHVPWMHTGRRPREGIHGSTREVDAPPGKFAVTQTQTAQSWGVALYNGYGGYTMGQVWADHAAPNAARGQFLEGSVVIKLLFTTATVEQVPWLAGTFEWEANVNSSLSTSSAKKIQTVRLLQADLAIKDSRASETGWVFGTLVYDNTSTGKTPWDRMMPVGIAWGNDPGVTASMVLAGIKLKETLLSPKIPAHAVKTLGWAGRLNGPADNPSSACMSCHMTSQTPPGPMVPKGSEDERLNWFRNVPGSEPFTGIETDVALDYSLQMAVAFRTFNDPVFNPNAP